MLVFGAFSDLTEKGALLEVLFDEDFLGGLMLRCSTNRAYRLPSSCLLNFSHGHRLEEEKQAKCSHSYVQPNTTYAGAMSLSSRSTREATRTVHAKQGSSNSQEVHNALPNGKQEQDRKDSTAIGMCNRLGGMASLDLFLWSAPSGRGVAAPSTRQHHPVPRYSQQSVTKQCDASSTGKREEEEFSAAMDALSKLEMSPATSSGQHGARSKGNLAPSVAAMFDAANSCSEQEHLSSPTSQPLVFHGGPSFSHSIRPPLLPHPRSAIPPHMPMQGAPIFPHPLHVSSPPLPYRYCPPAVE